MKKFGNIMWGLVFIIVGLILGLNALDITDIDIFFEGWWTLFIIVPSFIGIIRDDGKTGSVIGLIIGVFLLLACQDILSFDLIWKLLVPIVLVVIGLSFIFKDFLNSKIKDEINKIGNSDDSFCATFGGQDVNYANEEFKGCELTSVFGGVNCDLRKAKIKKDAVVNAFCVFGGIDLFVPENVKVKVVSTPIFGGVDNSHVNSNDEKDVTIYVKAVCIFGGVDIK